MKYTPWKTVQWAGEGHIQEIIQEWDWYIPIILEEAHTHIDLSTSKIFGVRVFEVENLGEKMTLFCGFTVNFLGTGAIRATFKRLNES